MRKVLAINKYTGIETRSSVTSTDADIINGPGPPTILEMHKCFVERGIPLAVAAAQKALAEAGITDACAAITHVVATTCTDSANPGFDLNLANRLGLSPQVERTLLHGVGCAGGLATLRTAANLALGHTARGKAARILCVACEISTVLVRSELDSIDQDQEVRIGPVLFSDGASAVLLSNGIGEHGDGPARAPVYRLLGWQHTTIPDTQHDLGFDVDPFGVLV